MCGGGGDGGASEIQADEARREHDMAAATREINKLFGIYNPDNFGEDGTYKYDAPLTREEWKQQHTGGLTPDPRQAVRANFLRITAPLFAQLSGNQDVFLTPDQRYDLYAANFGANVKGPYGSQDFGYGYTLPGSPASEKEAYSNYLSREAAYDKTRGDIMKYFTSGLDEQYRDSAQSQAYDLARKGLLKGSEELQAEAGRTRRYDDALFRLTNQADSSVNTLRSGDETARLNLLTAIRAGLDRESAVAGATATLRNNLDSAANNAYNTQFDNLFGDLNDIYKTYEYRQGQNRGAVMPYGYGSYSPGSKV